MSLLISFLQVHVKDAHNQYSLRVVMVCRNVEYTHMQHSGNGLICRVTSFKFFLPPVLPMAPHFVNCKSCSHHFNTDIKENFICCLCSAIDACTSDIDVKALTVCKLWSLASVTNSFAEFRTMPDMWEFLQAQKVWRPHL